MTDAQRRHQPTARGVLAESGQTVEKSTLKKGALDAAVKDATKKT